MTLAIAVKSCYRDQKDGFHQVIRETWGKRLPGTVQFFVGVYGWPARNAMGYDEVGLACPDDYDSLPFKTKAICNWFVHYTTCSHIFLCDTDTFIIPSKLLTCGYENYDLLGYIQRPFTDVFRYTAVGREGRTEIQEYCRPWPSGGLGYFLSRRAAQLVADSKPTSWAEDLWIGQLLSPRIAAGEMTGLDHKNFAGVISWHFPQARYGKRYDPSTNWMQEMYKEHGA
jgi:hypothetical protein